MKQKEAKRDHQFNFVFEGEKYKVFLDFKKYGLCEVSATSVIVKAVLIMDLLKLATVALIICPAFNKRITFSFSLAPFRFDL